MDKGYNVVFRGPNGILTWTTYESEAQYKEMGPLMGEAVKVNVSEERAIQLCDESLDKKLKTLTLSEAIRSLLS
jgi:hypothetical protein